MLTQMFNSCLEMCQEANMIHLLTGSKNKYVITNIYP